MSATPTTNKRAWFAFRVAAKDEVERALILATLEDDFWPRGVLARGARARGRWWTAMSAREASSDERPTARFARLETVT